MAEKLVDYSEVRENALAKSPELRKLLARRALEEAAPFPLKKFYAVRRRLKYRLGIGSV